MRVKKNKQDKETKSERFIRLANARVNKITKELELLGNLSSTNNYSYSKEQVEQIFDFLDKEYLMMKERFEFPNRKEPIFKLTNHVGEERNE